MRTKITYLDLVIPLVCIYMAILLIYTYFINGEPRGDWIDVVIIFSISFFFTYGVMAFVRDIRLFGWKWILTSWRYIYKKKIEK